LSASSKSGGRFSGSEARKSVNEECYALAGPDRT
jgi:hypothetical protein